MSSHLPPPRASMPPYADHTRPRPAIHASYSYQHPLPPPADVPESSHRGTPDVSGSLGPHFGAHEAYSDPSQNAGYAAPPSDQLYDGSAVPFHGHTAWGHRPYVFPVQTNPEAWELHTPLDEDDHEAAQVTHYYAEQEQQPVPYHLRLFHDADELSPLSDTSGRNLDVYQGVHVDHRLAQQFPHSNYTDVSSSQPHNASLLDSYAGDPSQSNLSAVEGATRRSSPEEAQAYPARLHANPYTEQSPSAGSVDSGYGGSVYTPTGQTHPVVEEATGQPLYQQSQGYYYTQQPVRSPSPMAHLPYPEEMKQEMGQAYATHGMIQRAGNWHQYPQSTSAHLYSQYQHHQQSLHGSRYDAGLALQVPSQLASSSHHTYSPLTDGEHRRRLSGPARSRSPPLVEDPPKKPLTLACLFCRKRKIACGSPPPGKKDRTCNQCARRSLVCVYPTISRRGMRPRAGIDSASTEGVFHMEAPAPISSR